MTEAVLLLRLGSAALFLAAALVMFRRRHNLQNALQDHGVTPGWARATSVVVPIVQSGLAIALLLPHLLLLGAVSGAFLLFSFAAATSLVMTDAKRRPCRSFRPPGADPGLASTTRRMFLGVLEDSERRALMGRRSTEPR